MDSELVHLVDELAERRTLSVEGYQALVEGACPELADLAARRAWDVRRRVFGDAVYVRGLIEISNHCKNDCLYCGLRRSNASCARYRLSAEKIVACADEGYRLGFRTFVLQGGEDPWFTDERLCDVVARLKRAHGDCAVTLSVGERPRESYQALRDAGADRYLLRHETADPAHYARLHPADMSHERRLACLRDLREVGFVVGCGFMVGSPYQTARNLALDLKFIEEFRPEMCGIGPFVPHHATPFAHEPAGSADLTCFLLSLIRLIQPNCCCRPPRRSDRSSRRARAGHARRRQRGDAQPVACRRAREVRALRQQDLHGRGGRRGPGRPAAPHGRHRPSRGGRPGTTARDRPATAT